MGTYTAPTAAANRPASTSASASTPTVNQGVFALSAALVLNDVVRLCKLPAQHVPVDFILDVDDLDAGTTMMVTAGIEDTVGATTNAAAFLSSSNVAQAGGIAFMNVRSGRRLAPVDYDRYVTMTVTVAGTAVATGTITCSLISRTASLADR